MAVDIFQTRVMLRALEQMYKPKMFLRDTFFKEVKTSNSRHVDIDIMKGKRRLAPYVSPLMEGKLVERVGFETKTYEPPYVKPKMVSTATEFLNRSLGEHIYAGNKTPAQRAREAMGKDLRTLNEEVDRLEESQAASVLDNGIVTAIGDGVNATIDFGMDATHKVTLTGNALWTDETNANPILNINQWKRLCAKDSGLVPDAVIMGATAWDNFVKHPKTKTALDTRRIDLGIIDPRMLPSGAQYMGYLKEAQVDVYTYDEYYLNSSAVLTPMVNVKKVLMGSTKARAIRHYGAIQDLEALASVSRFPKSWIKQDPSVRYVMIQSAPLMGLHQVDAFLAATVIG